MLNRLENPPLIPYVPDVAHDLFKIPNLISLGRLVFLAPTAYFLAQSGHDNTIYALICLTAASVSDYFDGYFARKLNQETELGLLLDPLSDKILAALLVMLLIVYRDFPLWLAAVIVGRDVLIASGGLAAKTKYGHIPSSNLAGKYAFASIAVLLISYIIRFDFGMQLFTVIALLLLGLSLILYGRGFLYVIRGRPFPVFGDKPSYRSVRTTITIVVSTVYLLKLLETIGWI